MITPDSERTKCTFLGIAGKINENDINIEAIKKSEITFFEGYLWDEGHPKRAFEKAIQNSKKTAMSLSDKFCVDRHKVNFLDLVKNSLDITFANEQEILSLIDAKTFDEVVSFGKSLGKLVVITRGEKGSIVINNNDVVECESKKNLNIKDLTGAGDLFAAGFLHGYINRLDFKESLKNAIEETGLELSQNSNLVFDINFTTKDTVESDRLNHYYSRYYWDNYMYRNEIYNITQNILRVNLRDIDQDKTLWTAVTVWRDGSNRSISYEDASSMLVDEIMLSFL